MEGQQVIEYIWLDAEDGLRSKLKINKGNLIKELSQCEIWNFDGSSTGQSKGNYSDVFLKPVRLYNDPFRKNHAKLVLCECYEDLQGTDPNKFNSRKQLAELQAKFAYEESLCGIEQEYVIYDRKTSLPVGWKTHKEPGNGPQGPYYCGVGGGKAFGRDFVEEHMYKCLESGINYFGLNAEVMPSQWEFQVGTTDPLRVSDDLWVARFILHKLSEKYDYEVTFDPKPEAGDWNGSGGHTNFSTKKMRGPNGIDHINDAMNKLGKTHKEDIKYYGKGNDRRMTGLHETSTMDSFSNGVGNRGCSVRISKQVHFEGKGYFEDRRPASSLDPYKVLYRIMKSIFDNEEIEEEKEEDKSSIE